MFWPNSYKGMVDLAYNSRLQFILTDINISPTDMSMDHPDLDMV